MKKKNLLDPTPAQVKYRNLLDPTPAQVKYRNRLWAEALLKNNRKARGEMYDSKGGRCCLAVASDVAASRGVSIEVKNDSFPPFEVARFFGWATCEPKLTVVLDDRETTVSAAELNDGTSQIDCIHIKDKKINSKGLSHKKISELVMNTFVNPSKVKQSFKIQ
jgi:hypothetical protein